MNNRNNNAGRTNRGCGNGGCNNGTGCREIMNQIRAVDFALTETVMYLDAYPDCAEAKKLYDKLVKERTELVEAYESKCGPLTMYGNRGGAWDWTDGPWPWEADAN